MATYLSKPYQGSEYVSGVPIDLITKVGMTKQLKYDQNVQEIQGNLDLIGQQDIIKDSERDYVTQKLGEATNNLNSYGGIDLSDDRTANQLKSYSGQLLRDKRVYNAIADTKVIRQQMQQMADLKEKDQSQYADQNAKLFMDEINNYVNGEPGKRYSGQGYIPYYNYDKTYRDIAKQVQDNPDITREIKYITMPDGTIRERGTQEIKQVTKEKIAQALINSGDQKAIRQMQIDYQTSLPNKTVDGAVQELTAQKDSFLADLQEAKNYLASGLTDPKQLQMAQSMVDKIEGSAGQEGVIKQLDQQINNVKSTGDVTQYYSFPKFAKDYINGLATSFAQRQEGKIETDDLFLEDYKFQNQMQLEELKSGLKLQKAGIGNFGTSGGFLDTYTNTFFNIEKDPNHEANADYETIRSLMDGSKNADGTMTLTLGQGSTFLNVGKVLEAGGVQETNSAKVSGYSKISKAFEDWNKKRLTQGYTPKSQGSALAQGSGGLDALNLSNARWSGNNIAANYQEFLASNEGKALAAKIKAETGLDMNSATDKQNIETYMTSPEAQELVSLGNKVSTIRGQVKTRPMNGNNMFVGSDGQYYTKSQALLTQAQIEKATGGFDKLLSAGLIEATVNEDGSGTKGNPIVPLYAVPIIQKVEKDIESAYTNYMTSLNASDNFYFKNLPGYQQNFKNNFTAITRTRGLNRDQVISTAENNLNKVASQVGSDPRERNAFEQMRNKVNQAKQIITSSGVSSADYINALDYLNTISTFTTDNTTTSVSSEGAKSLETHPREAGQTVAEYTNNPTNIKYIDNKYFKQLGGVDSGIRGTDGGTFMSFPSLEQGFKAFQAQLFGAVDGTFNTRIYKPNLTVHEAMKKWSNFRIENGTEKGYDGDIYPEIKNKTLAQLTQDERNTLSAKMLNIENSKTYQTMVKKGIIKKLV